MQRFTLTIFADGEGIAAIEDTPYPSLYESAFEGSSYVLSSRSHAEVCACVAAKLYASVSHSYLFVLFAHRLVTTALS